MNTPSSYTYDPPTDRGPPKLSLPHITPLDTFTTIPTIVPRQANLPAL